MFIAKVELPYIGQHKWTSFYTTLLIINKKTREDVILYLKVILPAKDEEVVRELYEQDKRKRGEYYSVKLHKVLEDTYVKIPDPSTGFPEPFEHIWI